MAKSGASARRSRAAPEAGGPVARREQRNLAAQRAYTRCAEIAGPLDFSPDPRVSFRQVASPAQRGVLTMLALFNALTALAFIGWLLLPAHVPGPGVVGFGGWRLGVARVSFCVVICVETIRLVQNFAVWTFAFAMKDPVPKAPPPGLRVAMLTTIVPSREPISVVERTLRAMRGVRYRGHVDVWILDEGDDPAVKAMAERLGVRHFSRKGVPRYNQPAGPFRAKTKSGNHNAWRDRYECFYDVVAQMDPDHVPMPCFLERTIGYFRDPDVAFVVAPQVYGNMYENWVAHGASVQQYLFSGVVERGGNGLDAPLLIGTNHLYRPAAWREIGGYQDSIIEDHLTGMRVQGTINPATGNSWRGVYTPDVLAIGEGPESWTDYFNQQKRWAYGIWEIVLKRTLRTGIRLRPRQRLLFGLVQFYYPSVGFAVLLGTIATAIYLLLGITAVRLDSLQWLALWSASMASWIILWLWLRRFNLAAHERREVGAAGMLLALFAGPVYVVAGVTALFRRPLTYAVTAKGSLKSADSVRTFRLHLAWAAIATILLIVSFRFHHYYAALRVWGTLALVTGLGPPLIGMAARLGHDTDAVARAPSALVPYDSAWVPYDVRIPSQVASASPVRQTQFPDAIRPAERVLAHEAGHRLITHEARRETTAVRPGHPAATVRPPPGGSAGEYPAYRGRAFERPADGNSAHHLSAQPAEPRDTW
jgi:cellulose synthase/poly-beta-1,6-N-acetylglucosamine synthase-like glycosyltransferase